MVNSLFQIRYFLFNSGSGDRTQIIINLSRFPFFFFFLLYVCAKSLQYKVIKYSCGKEKDHSGSYIQHGKGKFTLTHTGTNKQKYKG